MVIRRIDWLVEEEENVKSLTKEFFKKTKKWLKAQKKKISATSVLGTRKSPRAHKIESSPVLTNKTESLLSTGVSYSPEVPKDLELISNDAVKFTRQKNKRSEKEDSPFCIVLDFDTEEPNVKQFKRLRRGKASNMDSN